MLERKSWASGETAKTAHATFLCLTHNLMVLLEEEVHTSDGIDNTTERERKKLREEETQEAGGGYVATAIAIHVLDTPVIALAAQIRLCVTDQHVSIPVFQNARYGPWLRF